jgi:hypothetical protein
MLVKEEAIQKVLMASIITLLSTVNAEERRRAMIGASNKVLIRLLVHNGGNKDTIKNSCKPYKINIFSFYFLLFTFALSY